MTADRAALEVCQISLRANSRKLLDAVSFDVLPGEVVAILGPNGAGKTTLLEIIAGLRRADQGTIAFHGVRPRSFSDRAELLAFLPDGGELPAELRVGSIVEHALRFRARPFELLQRLQKQLDIDSLYDIPTGVLSRGERQRIGLFCALVVDRSVVVLDEPFNAFDPLRVRSVVDAVRQVADTGASIVASIHHLGQAAQIADRMLILDEGRVIAWGGLESMRSAADLPHGTIEEIFVALLSRSGHAP